MNTLYCKHCGGFLEQSLSNVLLSDPPKYGYVCKDCSKVEYLTGLEVMKSTGVLNSQTRTATNGMSKEDKRNFMCGW